MLEKVKTVLLIFLVVTAVLLNYRLWFGGPSPLQEETAARYEQAHFMPPPSREEIVMPAEAVLFLDDELYYYRRGHNVSAFLWQKCRQLLVRERLEELERLDGEDKETLLSSVSNRALFRFDPPLPLQFISEQAVNDSIDAAVLLWDEAGMDVLLEWHDGGFSVKSIFRRDEQLLTELVSAAENEHLLLPPVLELYAAGSLPGEGKESLPNDLEGEMGPQEVPGEGEEEMDLQEDLEDETVPEDDEDEAERALPDWEVEVAGDIYVPRDSPEAAVLALHEEEISNEQLVRAFFFDLSMARRIQERDGALYYTDGEKGLRIYPSGLIEYTAPRLESPFSEISYSGALVKAAESQSLYGGWLGGTYLHDTRRVGGGYRFTWKSYHDGLMLVGENKGSVMLVNERGVPFYSRYFHFFGEELSEYRPFSSYEEALLQALALHEDSFPRQRATLLSMKPVYYFSMEKRFPAAVPAWQVELSGVGTTYLRWDTLEPLE